MRQKIRQLMILGEIQITVSRFADDKRWTDINERIEELKGMMLQDIDSQLTPEASLNFNPPYQI
jgi:hypothetical protein